MKSVRPHPTTGEPIVEGEREPGQAAERDPRERNPPASPDEAPAPDDQRPPARQPGIMN